MKFIRIFAVSLLASMLCITAACGQDSQANKEETRTVEWYMAPENKVALEEKLAQCKSNPGELANTPNCINAANARHKLFASPPTIKIR